MLPGGVFLVCAQCFLYLTIFRAQEHDLAAQWKNFLTFLRAVTARDLSGKISLRQSHNTLDIWCMGEIGCLGTPHLALSNSSLIWFHLCEELN